MRVLCTLLSEISARIQTGKKRAKILLRDKMKAKINAKNSKCSTLQSKFSTIRASYEFIFYKSIVSRVVYTVIIRVILHKESCWSSD